MEVQKKPEKCLSIDDVRQQIDLIDQKIIGLFADRQRYVKAIVRFKADEEEVVALDRKNLVIEERARAAASYGLNPELFKKIFTILLEENIRKELEIFNANKKITSKSE